MPVGLLTGAGATGVSVDLDVLPTAAYDELAGLLEQGRPVHLGVVPNGTPSDRSRTATSPSACCGCWTCSASTRVGVDLVVTPSCGLAGADARWARRALDLCRAVAANLRP